MLNAYPDSIGHRLADLVHLLQQPELEHAFSLLYLLPTFFNSDLDRGFSIIDYDLNAELVSPQDLQALDALGIMLKLDLILNHLSVGSPQFQDLLRHGDQSDYRDFFIDWNEFWQSHGEPGPEGHVIPHEDHLNKLFMRKPGLPILKVGFPDGSSRPYWNTFYQQVSYHPITPQELSGVAGLSQEAATEVSVMVNTALEEAVEPDQIYLDGHALHRDRILSLLHTKRRYLGQMDLNAESEKVWSFYDDTLRKLKGYGARIIRLDAFAYLHKRPGERNFFNKPGTWDYLERLKGLARQYDLIIFPEVHAEFGTGLHEEVAEKGFPIYDFFFPGLVIDALDRGNGEALRRWIDDIRHKDLQTINMLGCHDGIPVLDLRGARIEGVEHHGLLDDELIDTAMERIIERGGRVKNLYGPDGKKISYYQVNATFFSALGEDEQKLLLARAIQLFMPGIPQVWYLDLFAGKNDYAAADSGGTAGHKEINRTNLSVAEVTAGLQRPVVRHQLDMIRLRNTSPAFAGELHIDDTPPHLLHLTWRSGNHRASLKADLCDTAFEIEHQDPTGAVQRIAHSR
ncbi:glycosidase [Thiohalocapsa marina]|uniref:Glycosidase n=1 Tax=Thiohalocapsa marina TaxID=424902 RepID=A0A5M8FFH5_9GAMM|nr:glycosidase [Thiohalocapsa marina]KAA6183638.1 glycosidase [Thiohalocapsa marina]